jgi:hypothetical protein
MNSGLFIEMLKVLMHRRRKPLLLILDSLPAHKGKAVRNYVESTNGKLELHFLPGVVIWQSSPRTGPLKIPRNDFQCRKQPHYASIDVNEDYASIDVNDAAGS